MKQAMEADQAVALIPGEAVLMIGGFMGGVGTPQRPSIVETPDNESAVHLPADLGARHS